MEQSERLTAEGLLDFEEFMDRIKKLLDAAWGKSWGVFSSEFPTGNEPEKHKLPHIAYVMRERVPAVGHGLKGKRYDPVPDPDHPGETMIPIHSWHDHVVEFRVYANTNLEATKISKDFGDFMTQYAGYFKEQGITEIIFRKECFVEPNDFYRQTLPYRSLSYDVQVQSTIHERTYVLKRILAEVAGGPNLQTPTVKETTVIGGNSDPSNPGNNQVTNIGEGDFLSLYERHFPRS